MAKKLYSIALFEPQLKYFNIHAGHFAKKKYTINIAIRTISSIQAATPTQH